MIFPILTLFIKLADRFLVHAAQSKKPDLSGNRIFLTRTFFKAKVHHYSFVEKYEIRSSAPTGVRNRAR